MAKVKAGILAGILADQNNINTIQNEARLVAMYGGNAQPAAAQSAAVQEYNSKVVKTFQTFAKKFDDLANAVGDGQMSYQDAQKSIGEEFLKVVKSEWTDQLDVSRKWIPPYGFVHHAEYGYEKYNVQDKAQPVLVYVGTVMHEKFLRKKGEKPGKKPLSVMANLVASPEDLALDQEIYKRLDCAVKNDGNGWRVLLSHMNPSPTARPECGKVPTNFVKMTQAEYDAVRKMISDWEMKPSPTDRDIFVHNTFGLDPVLASRLLASFWNDPTKFFKVSIYEGPASTIDTAVLNIRLLLSTETVTLNPKQADSGQYLQVGHPRRETPVPCLAFAAIEGSTCRQGKWSAAFAD
jgi:hypothetical protein